MKSRDPEPGTGTDGEAAATPWSALDAALAAYREGRRDAVLVMRTDVGGAEEVPAALFFRSESEMGSVERRALAEARGRVLDLGAGPGAHAAPLVSRGLDVTAAEVLPAAQAALREAGVSDVRAGGLETVAKGERFDTVLVLMNGLGLAGTLARLPTFLERLAAVLEPGGQVLGDSTDPTEWEDDEDGRAPGEAHMQLAFEGTAGPPFPFLFVAPDTLTAVAASVGLRCEILEREDDGRYLARLTLSV